jgi:hypothetical protein
MEKVGILFHCLLLMKLTAQRAPLLPGLEKNPVFI